MNGPAATRIELGASASGIGCVAPSCALTAVDPVTVLSAKMLPPRAVHPESAAPPATTPANATTFSAP